MSVDEEVVRSFTTIDETLPGFRDRVKLQRGCSPKLVVVYLDTSFAPTPDELKAVLALIFRPDCQRRRLPRLIRIRADGDSLVWAKRKQWPYHPKVIEPSMILLLAASNIAT